MLAVCGQSGAESSVYGDFRASSLGTLIQMVAGGLGVTLLPRIAADTLGGPADPALVPFREPGPSRSVGFAWRTGSPRRAEFERLARPFSEFDRRGPGE